MPVSDLLAATIFSSNDYLTWIRGTLSRPMPIRGKAATCPAFHCYIIKRRFYRYLCVLCMLNFPSPSITIPVILPKKKKDFFYALIQL